MAALRAGSIRSPNAIVISSVPITRGTPTSANSKNPNGPPADSAANSEMMTLTGVPVSVSIEPAWAANASGSSNCDGGRPMRTATTTAIGSSAATAPFTLISAVSPATSSITSSSTRVRLAPAVPRPPARAAP